MNDKIEITKIGKEYYDNNYQISNLDVPKELYFPDHVLSEDIERDTYHFECWEYVVSGSWNRSYKNKLRYYAPVYRNSENKSITLDMFIFEDDTVKKAQKKISDYINKIREQFISTEKEYLKRANSFKMATQMIDKY